MITAGELKNQYFQALRGLAITAVVLIHSFNPSLNDQELNATIQVVFRQIFNFAIPLFMFLSGFFVVQEKYDALGWKGFIARRLKRIVIPYIVWSLVASFLFLDFDPATILFRISTGTAVGPYYFIIALVQMILLTPLIIESLKNNKLRWFLLAITPISLVFYYLYLFVFQGQMVFPYYALPFFMWFIFYYIGVMFRNTDVFSRTDNMNPRWLIAGYGAFMLVSIISGMIYYNHGYFEFSVTQIRVSSFLGSFFLIWLLMSYRKEHELMKGSILAVLGDYSFGIFFIHIFVKAAILKMGVLTTITNQFIYMSLMGIMTLAISASIVHITIVLFGRKISDKYLGF